MSLDLNDLISAQESNGFLSLSQVDWLHRSVQANLDAIPMVSFPQVADRLSCDVTDLPQGSLWFEVEWARLMRELGYDGELFLLFEEGRGGLYGQEAAGEVDT